MTEKELAAGQMYLSALFRIGELKQENDRLHARLAEATQILRRCKATCSPARVEEIDEFLEALAAQAQTGTPRTVPPLPDAGSEPRPGH